MSYVTGSFLSVIGFVVIFFARPKSGKTDWVARFTFLSELYAVAAISFIVRLSFNSHPQMLRHAYGFALANNGQDTRALQAHLVNKNIQHTVRYTELSTTRFGYFWCS